MAAPILFSLSYRSELTTISHRTHRAQNLLFDVEWEE